MYVPRNSWLETNVKLAINLLLSVKDSGCQNRQCSERQGINVDPSNLLQIPLPENIFYLMSLNTCSLTSHFLSIELKITDNFRPSLIGIREIKITNEIETLYNIAGYNMLPNNNQSNKGGIALYIKNSIPVTVKSQQTSTRKGIETIFADLNTQIGIITVAIVYTN